VVVHQTIVRHKEWYNTTYTTEPLKLWHFCRILWLWSMGFPCLYTCSECSQCTDSMTFSLVKFKFQLFWITITVTHPELFTTVLLWLAWLIYSQNIFHSLQFHLP